MAPLRSAARSAPGNPDETGPMRPGKPCPRAPANSVSELPSSLSSPVFFELRGSARDVQPGEHFLHRGHRGGELCGIARPTHEIGVRLHVLVLERVAADYRIRLSMGDVAQLTADISF